MPETSKPLSLEFFINPQWPPDAVPTEVASIDVCPSEMMTAPEKEAPVAVLETDHSIVGEHLSTVEVGPSKEPDFLPKVTRESEEHDVSKL